MVLILSNCAGVAFTGGVVFRDLGPARLSRFFLSYGVVILAYWLLIVRSSPLVGGRLVAMLIVVGPTAAFSSLLQARFAFSAR